MGFKEPAVEFDQQLLMDHLTIGRKEEYLKFSLHIFESLPSTNQTLWELVNQQEQTQPGSVVIAREQSAGRGQWGRQWQSPLGGLYLSLAMGCPQLKATDSYQLTLATAWGIAAQLQKCSIPAQIKWPNDLILDGYKLGGILTETKVNQGQITQAVIGVGINWSNPVPDTGINLQMWQSSRNLDLISCLEMLTSRVLLGIESGMQRLQQEGIGILLSDYLELLANIGDRVYFDNLLATVIGVTQQGELRLKMAAYNTEETATSSEISVPPGTISLGYR